MANRELLTQEEIDALVKGAGESVDEEGADALETTNYDLASQDRVVRGRLPTLELINEKFARFFRTSLYNLMRHAADIGVGGIQIMKYSEYVQNLYVPTSVNFLRVKPMTGVALCVLDAKLVVRLVDRFFGGDGRQIKFEGREFTAHRAAHHQPSRRSRARRSEAGVEARDADRNPVARQRGESVARQRRRR